MKARSAPSPISRPAKDEPNSAAHHPNKISEARRTGPLIQLLGTVTYEA